MNNFTNNPYNQGSYQMNGTQPYQGFGYNVQQPQQQPQLVQFLTADQIKEIRSNPQIAFKTKLTREEYLRSICTHVDQNGRIALEKLANGHHRCNICGAEFTLLPLETSNMEIQKIIQNFYDFLQSIKLYNGSASEDLKQIYIMCGFIPEFINLWKISKSWFEKITSNTVFGVQSDDNTTGFGILNSVFGGVNPYYQYPNTFPGQTPYYQYQQQPMNYQVPNYVYPPQQGQPMQPNVPPMPNIYGQQPNNPQVNNAYQQNNGQQNYGFNPNIQTPQQAAQAQQPNVSINPVGYVDNPKDFTATIPQHQNQQQQVVTGPTVNSGTQPAPTNPNIKAPGAK